MSYSLGQTVVFNSDYNGFKRGSKGYFICMVEDSGSYVPLVAIDDEAYQRFLETNEIESLDCDMMRNQIANNQVIYLSLTTSKPWPSQISSVEELIKSRSDAVSVVKDCEELLGFVTEVRF